MCNYRFEFYEKILLDKYLTAEGDTPATYILHAVLVQILLELRY
jgi:hypothetical protein